MFVICANTIEEAERDLEAMKLAYESGMSIGCGGDTIEDVEKALNCLWESLAANREEEEEVEITNPNYKEADEELIKLFETLGLDVPDEEDLEGIHRVFENMATVIGNLAKAGLDF